MDLSKEFSGVQASAEVKMKRYADERMDKLIDILSSDNPSLIKMDMLKSLARSEIAYGCCHYDTTKHKRCKNVATLRGYCETHVQKTAYEKMMEGNELRNYIPVKTMSENGLFSFGS